MSFNKAGLELYLLGTTHSDLAGSEWAFLHGQRGGNSPTADLQNEMNLIEVLLAGRSEKIFTAAHDLSQGGLAMSITEMVLRHMVGATISLKDTAIDLLSETPGRVIVAVESSQAGVLLDLCAKYKISLSKLGTTGGDSLVINETTISLQELKTAHTSTFPKLFG
jgi:phosphoribosylformylglycinamidine synthase